MEMHVTVQTAAAIITALSAVGVFGLVHQIYKTILEHDRVLFGEDSVSGWDGIVPMVQRHEQEIDELQRSQSD